MSHLFWLTENLNQSNWIVTGVYITWSINRNSPTLHHSQFYLHGIGNVYQGFLLILMVQEWDATETELMVRCSGRHKLSNCAWFKLNLRVPSQGPDWNFFLLFYPSITRKLVADFSPIRVNTRKVFSAPFPKPEDEFDLHIGDWNSQSRKVIYPVT